SASADLLARAVPASPSPPRRRRSSLSSNHLSARRDRGLRRQARRRELVPVRLAPGFEPELAPELDLVDHPDEDDLLLDVRVLPFELRDDESEALVELDVDRPAAVEAQKRLDRVGDLIVLLPLGVLSPQVGFPFGRGMELEIAPSAPSRQGESVLELHAVGKPVAKLRRKDDAILVVERGFEDALEHFLRPFRPGKLDPLAAQRRSKAATAYREDPSHSVPGAERSPPCEAGSARAPHDPLHSNSTSERARWRVGVSALPIAPARGSPARRGRRASTPPPASRRMPPSALPGVRHTAERRGTESQPSEKAGRCFAPAVSARSRRPVRAMSDLPPSRASSPRGPRVRTKAFARQPSRREFYHFDPYCGKNPSQSPTGRPNVPLSLPNVTGSPSGTCQKSRPLK